MQPRDSAYRRCYRRFNVDILVLLAASCVFLPLVISPPHLMNDVDAVQAQIARTMLQTGDWVTARLDGVTYLEKSPLIYWIMACCYKVFGVHDWAARFPLALINIILCWVTARFALWGFGRRSGFYAGTILATCVGMFLFTRILIPDSALTLTITLALWSCLRLLDASEPRRWLWFAVLYSSLACGLLLKGLIATVFPVGIFFMYLVVTREYGWRDVVMKFRPLAGVAVVLLIAAPWHILATLRNPPYFDWTMHSKGGEYHGFLWFYFLNEHIFRFLNMRYPRDYNTVPRLWFLLFHFAWLFPWSATMIGAFRHNYRPINMTGRVRLLALIWIGVVLVFFSFSTTQEYYSLPIYPALALLLASDLSTRDRYPVVARAVLVCIFGLGLCTVSFLLVTTAKYSTPGDISASLAYNPDLYSLSLGHLADLRLQSFAYLRFPLILAGCALSIGAIGVLCTRTTLATVAALAVAMIVFVEAARLALVTFDPYLGSKPLADALLRSEPGTLIEADSYYAFSSVFFYTNRQALLWNGRNNNLEYGSYAPGAPDVFIDDTQLQNLWNSRNRVYLLVYGSELSLVGPSLSKRYNVVAASGGNYLLCNRTDFQM